MSIDNLDARMQLLVEVLSELGLGSCDRELVPGDDALGQVEQGVNDLMLDLQTLRLANQEKAAFLELQQRSIAAKEAQLAEQGRALAAQLATIAAQQELLASRERELEASIATVGRQSEAIRQLGVPLIEVEDRIVALPLIGALDTARAEALMERLLEHVVRTRSRHVILDLTGTDLPDSDAIAYLERIVHAVRLLGARCILSGMSPAMAQSLADNGVELGGIRTFRTLKDGLRDALRVDPLARRSTR